MFGLAAFIAHKQRPPVRIEFREDAPGHLDEVVVWIGETCVHFEMMADGHLWGAISNQRLKLDVHLNIFACDKRGRLRGRLRYNAESSYGGPPGAGFGDWERRRRLMGATKIGEWHVCPANAGYHKLVDPNGQCQMSHQNKALLDEIASAFGLRDAIRQDAIELRVLADYLDENAVNAGEVDEANMLRHYANLADGGA